MRKLIIGSLFAAPLLMGMAILGAGAAQSSSHLPGREVNANEASQVLGAGCLLYKNFPCGGNCGTNDGASNCASLGALAGGGCSSSCSFSLAVIGGCG